MTGQTHRVYAVFFAFITVILNYKYNMININYYVTLIFILLLAKEGARFPDLDHAWKNIHSKTVPNKIINSVIHLTGGKHRSWQTHSIDICTLFILVSIFIINKIYNIGYLSDVNKEIMTLVIIGFSSGWVSHLFSDMLTSGGIRLFCFTKLKLRLVPRKIGKLRFNTGNEWEEFNYKVISIINKIAGFICLVYPIITGDTFKDILKKIFIY